MRLKPGNDSDDLAEMTRNKVNNTENDLNCANSDKNQLNNTHDQLTACVHNPPTTTKKSVSVKAAISTSPATDKNRKLLNVAAAATTDEALAKTKTHANSNTTDGARMQNTIRSIEAYPLCVRKTPKFPSRERHMAIRRKNYKQTNLNSNRDYINDHSANCLHHNDK